MEIKCTLHFEYDDSGYDEDDPVCRARGYTDNGVLIKLTIPANMMPKGSGQYDVTLHIEEPETEPQDEPESGDRWVDTF